MEAARFLLSRTVEEHQIFFRPKFLFHYFVDYINKSLSEIEVSNVISIVIKVQNQL